MTARTGSAAQVGVCEPSYWVDLLGCQVRYLDVPYRTRIIEAGHGDLLLLLHGTGGHVENYVRNIPALARHFHVVALDFRWHGCSDTEDFDPAIFPMLVAQVRAVARALGHKTYSLEGQSLGGWVAMRLAIEHPDDIDALILTTPMGYVPTPGRLDWKGQPRSALRESSLAVLRDPSWDNVKQRLERLMADPAKLPVEAIAVRHKLYNDQRLNQVQQAFVASYMGGEEAGRYEVTDEMLLRIDVPALLYWGDHNPVPPAVGQHMARQMPRARFHCAENTGHWAQFESADEHDRVVIDFLCSTKAATGGKEAALASAE